MTEVPEQPTDTTVPPQPAADQPYQEVELMADEDGSEPDSITEPGKLLRIALMLREMQEEVRRADPDEAGRQRLRQIHETSLSQMRSVLTGGLQEELDALTLPFDTDTPTESEIRIAQAQLIGWLEGLFQGIQAAIASQQMSARQQLERMQRSLPPGMQPGSRGPGGPGGPGGPQPGPGGGRPGGPSDDRPTSGTGQYL